MLRTEECKIIVSIAIFLFFSTGYDISEDYSLACNVRLEFERNDLYRCNTDSYTIINDTECEENEFFILQLVVITSDPGINVDSSASEAHVFINDLAEPECSKNIIVNFGIIKYNIAIIKRPVMFAHCCLYSTYI